MIPGTIGTGIPAIGGSSNIALSKKTHNTLLADFLLPSKEPVDIVKELGNNVVCTRIDLLLQIFDFFVLGSLTFWVAVRIA